MLITGGRSPFYAANRFRTIANILTGRFHLPDSPELAHVSREAKAFVRDLLTTDPAKRQTASECLAHPWLASEPAGIDTLYTLETGWMKRLLARRRWQRWFNAVRAAQRIRKLSAPQSAWVNNPSGSSV